VFGGHGTTAPRFNDFRQVLDNPCPAAKEDEDDN
jgi:hypothetical protein